jgi:hypothetical protein
MAMDVETGALGEFGDWAIDEKLFNYIQTILPEGSTILELGSGHSTDALAKHYTMYSVEHDAEWLDKYDSTYLHVPLCEHKAVKGHTHTRWYDASILKPKLKGIKYDLLLVDGPPTTRSGFVKYMSLFDSDAIWIFDDANRSGDRAVVNSVASKLRQPWVTYHGVAKTFSVINTPLLTPTKEDGTP